jgi:perosamine synthetase
MVTVVLGSSYSVSKERLIAEFKKRNIDTRPFFYPLSSMPAYEHLEQAKTARSRNETAYRISPSAINLPSALSLTKEQVHFVCATLREIVEL